MKGRCSGILLHITSLPSPYGIGDLGPGAYRFAQFLQEARQRLWQVLPLNPTDPAFGNSPYSSASAFAGDPLFISPELMVGCGLLAPEEAKPPQSLPQGRADYDRARLYKERLLRLAYRTFRTAGSDPEYMRFCEENSYWLEDYALYKAIKAHYRGKAWNEWPPALRDRDASAIEEAKRSLGEAMEEERFREYLFFRQWFSLKRYCNERGISIIGDLPIYVNTDSVDVWRSPQIFKLDPDGRPCFVAGVPPDYFSSTGQLWGNPVYRWDVLKADGFGWWVERMRHSLRLFDVVRIDHFRGLVAYWEIPAHEKTAINGRWLKAPADDFLRTLQIHFPNLPIIAEDLGFIDPEVREIMSRYRIPGMKVLLFAFGEDNPQHPYLPHNYQRECVVYTGTHDNNTIRGWMEGEAKPAEVARLFRYLGRKVPLSEVHWELIRLAMLSVADMVLVPFQDLLGLGSEARMNHPSTSEGNWEWRLSEGQLDPALAGKLRDMTEVYNRT